MKIKGLHHIAYKCRDPEETRAFYEDVLGLPLTLALEATTVPTTGGPAVTYLHFFFEMGDGSSIAFFDLADDQVPLPSPNVPAWANHLAIEVQTLDQLNEMHSRIAAAGVEVTGELDHHFVRSIYFFDPNGVRLEITAAVAESDYKEKGVAQGRQIFTDWIDRRRDEVKREAVAA